MDIQWTVSGPDKIWHVQLQLGHVWNDANYKRAWLRSVGNDINKNSAGCNKQDLLVQYYNTAIKPDPPLQQQNGHNDGHKVQKWVVEEMKLKTIFVVDSKRIDHARLTTYAARIPHLLLAGKPQSSPRPEIPSGLC